MTTENASLSPAEVAPACEEAVALLKRQLTGLDEIAERNYSEVQDQEREWAFLTEAIVAKCFGADSPQYDKLIRTKSIGTENVQNRFDGPDYERLQVNFEARSRQRKVVLKSLMAELDYRLHHLKNEPAI
jgi:hypothetical protein